MELMLKPENYTYEQLSDLEFQTCAKALLPLQTPLEQSPTWGRFDDAIAGREFLGSFRYNDSSGKLVALGSATLYRQKGRDWIWFKHGPLFATVPNTDVIKKLCATLRQQFSVIQNAKPVFIRLAAPTYVQPLRLPFEHSMYDETVVVELEQSEDEILHGMSQSGRRGLRKAEKASIEVKELPLSQAIKDFEHIYYPLMHETAERDGFGAHPASLYTSMLESLGEDCVRMYVASNNGKPLAWAITTEYGTQAMYYYGASSHEARELNAPYLLHWEIMKAMKARGNKTYDFMGIAGRHFSGLKNVTQFKIKFSKNIVSVPITYDLPLQPLKYRLMSTAIKTKRKFT